MTFARGGWLTWDGFGGASSQWPVGRCDSLWWQRRMRCGAAWDTCRIQYKYSRNTIQIQWKTIQYKYNTIQLRFNANTIESNEIHPKIQLKQKGNSKWWGGELFRGRYQPNPLILTSTLQSNLKYWTMLEYNYERSGTVEQLDSTFLQYIIRIKRYGVCSEQFYAQPTMHWTLENIPTNLVDKELSCKTTYCNSCILMQTLLRNFWWWL